MTPKVSSNSFTNSESSIRVISLKASRSSSVESFAIFQTFLIIRMQRQPRWMWPQQRALHRSPGHPRQASGTSARP